MAAGEGGDPEEAEASCPSGVPVTDIIQAAKEQAAAETGAGIICSVIGGLVRHPAVFHASARLALLAFRYPGEFKARSAECRVRKYGNKAAKGRVVFFPGCAVEHFQADIGTAAMNVLEATGYEVVVPEGLLCCGRQLLSLEYP